MKSKLSPEQTNDLDSVGRVTVYDDGHEERMKVR